MDDQKCFDLELCLEEIVSNSFSHGNPKDPVTIFVCIQNNEIKVSIHDMAPPFHLLKKALKPPQMIKEPMQGQGGFGLHLVKNLIDRIEYSYSENGNHTTPSKTI